MRPEMKGPSSDIDDILSGLKTKPETKNIELNIHENVRKDEDSMISVSSLKDLDSNSMPKKSKKRNKSDKVVVSLDI